MKLSILFTAVASTFAFSLAPAVHAAPTGLVDSNLLTGVSATGAEYDGATNASGGNTGIDALDTDHDLLLNTDSHVSFTSSNFSAFGQSKLSYLNDGTLGDYAAPQSTQTAIDSVGPWTLDVKLDTTSSGSTTGYALTNIKVYAGWTRDFAGQDFTLSYLPVGSTSSTTPTLLGTFSYNPSVSNNPPVTTEISINLAPGAQVTNVSDLIFNFDAVPGDNYGAYSEIEAFDTPVPEPGTWALLVGGLACLLAIQRVRAVRA